MTRSDIKAKNKHQYSHIILTIKTVLLFPLIISCHFGLAGTTDHLEEAEQACDKNDGYACGVLGLFYANDKSSGFDVTKALHYLSKSCELKVTASCTEMGHIYSDGRGVTVNKQKSRSLYTQACELRDSRGCLWAGLSYRSENITTAVSYYDKACALGNQLGCQYVKNLKPSDPLPQTKKAP